MQCDLLGCQGPTGIRTLVAGFKVQSANHYTIGPHFNAWYWQNTPTWLYSGTKLTKQDCFHLQKLLLDKLKDVVTVACQWRLTFISRRHSWLCLERKTKAIVSRDWIWPIVYMACIQCTYNVFMPYMDTSATQPRVVKCSSVNGAYENWERKDRAQKRGKPIIRWWQVMFYGSMTLVSNCVFVLVVYECGGVWGR